MNKIIAPGSRTGAVNAPSSKSQAHRILICAALALNKSVITCPGISKDIEATIACLKEMGAQIQINGDMISVQPIDRAALRKFPGERMLRCSESGSTLRFLLPVVGALGISAAFVMEGRLPERPMQEYEEVLREHGMNITREGNLLHASGQLMAGTFALPGNISSQYFSGLLFALPLIEGDSRIMIEGKLESEDYVIMTENALRESGIKWNKLAGGYEICGSQTYTSKPQITVEGDYSNAAFFLCAGALSSKGIKVNNLSEISGQGDRRIVDVLQQFGAEIKRDGDGIFVRRNKLNAITIDGSMIPDLIPVLSVVAAAADGITRIIHAERLRMKESDRIMSTVDMLKSIGACVTETQDGMIIEGREMLTGGTVDSYMDHRIAMAAAVAAGVCREPVTVIDAQCVSKSYPRFWDDLELLEADR